ncbi:MAG: hypothetical protein EXQ99_01465 [Alphaproteobacteria bacterium]|nr:hypothetical protein [Alphaproteobacteria bacterium]
MPVSDPAGCRDKTGDWLAHFATARLRKLKPQVKAGLLAEFELDPAGAANRHSAALQQLLNFTRSVPIQGKTFVYVAQAAQTYRVGILQGRGNAPRFVDDRHFRDEMTAVRAAFRHRLAALGLIESGAESDA